LFFVDEPTIPPAFFSLDSVVLQPHNASDTRETRELMGKRVLVNLAAYLAAQPLLTAVV